MREVCVCGLEKTAHHIFNEEEMLRNGFTKKHIKIMKFSLMFANNSVISNRIPCHEYRRDNLKYLEEVANNG